MIHEMKLSNVEEKLDAIDQIIHQAQLRTAILRKKASAIESVSSSVITSGRPKVGFTEVRYLLNATTIPEEPEIEEFTPQNLRVLQSRAKIIYEKMTHRLEPINKNILRSVTPTLSLAKL